MDEKRVRRSGAEKAQEALEVTMRKLARVEARRDKAKSAITVMEAEIESLRADAEYYGSHPGLRQQ